MRAISRFSLHEIPGPGARSEVRLDGRPTGHTAPGCVLEAQFELDRGYLLLTTEGSPFEEALHVTLVDRHLHPLDERTLAIPYKPGVLRDVAVVSDTRIEFSFFGDERWRLTVQDRPRLLPGLRRRHPGQGLRDLFTRHRLDLEIVVPRA